jgi:hypothetical protein
LVGWSHEEIQDAFTYELIKMGYRKRNKPGYFGRISDGLFFKPGEPKLALEVGSFSSEKWDALRPLVASGLIEIMHVDFYGRTTLFTKNSCPQYFRSDSQFSKRIVW